MILHWPAAGELTCCLLTFIYWCEWNEAATVCKIIALNLLAILLLIQFRMFRSLARSCPVFHPPVSPSPWEKHNLGIWAALFAKSPWHPWAWHAWPALCSLCSSWCMADSTSQVRNSLSCARWHFSSDTFRNIINKVGYSWCLWP